MKNQSLLFPANKSKNMFWYWDFGKLTGIGWTGVTWNTVSGCNKVSQGCKNCYAERMTERLLAMGLEKYAQGFNKVVCHPSTLKEPYKWKKPSLVFVNSMSDLFHKDVPLSYIKSVFKVMNELPQHTFQVLTKRAKRLAEVSNELNWTDNIWMGVSIEDEKVVDRLTCLKQTKAKTKFLSCEPLIGSLKNLDIGNIDWVIVGGESSPKKKVLRKMKELWALELRDKCFDKDIPFFFKQWGGINKKKAGYVLDGCIYHQFPKSLALEQYAKRKLTEFPATVSNVYNNQPEITKVA